MTFEIALWLTGGAVGTTGALIAFYPRFCKIYNYVPVTYQPLRDDVPEVPAHIPAQPQREGSRRASVREAA